MALWKTVWQIFRRLNIHLSDDLTIPFQELLERNQNLCSYSDLQVKVDSSIIHDSQKHAHASVNGGTNRKNKTHIWKYCSLIN